MKKEDRADQPILIFDSGVGGLTVLDALREVLPDAPVIFAADQAGLPYGTKSEAEITARVIGLLGRMSERYQPRLICIACNTASTIALREVREVLETPIVGTVPAIKPAAAITNTGTIGLLGTQATVRQTYVDDLEQKFGQGSRLIRHAAPELVEPAEAKLRGEKVDLTAIKASVDALLAHPGGDAIDTVILACTHFPLLRDELSQYFRPGVQFVDGSQGIARRIVHLLQGQSFSRSSPDLALTTGDMVSFNRLTPSLARRGINRIEQF